jgi:hypothetical protein
MFVSLIHNAMMRGAAPGAAGAGAGHGLGIAITDAGATSLPAACPEQAQQSSDAIAIRKSRLIQRTIRSPR